MCNRLSLGHRESFVNAFYAFLGLTHLASRSTSGSIYKLLNTLHVKATGRGASSLYGSRSASIKTVKSPRSEEKPSKSRSGSAIEEELTDPLTEEDVEAVIAYRCLKAVAGTHTHTHTGPTHSFSRHGAHGDTHTRGHDCFVITLAQHDRRETSLRWRSTGSGTCSSGSARSRETTPYSAPYEPCCATRTLSHDDQYLSCPPPPRT